MITERLRAFRQGLKETGYVDGENVAIERQGVMRAWLAFIVASGHT